MEIYLVGGAVRDELLGRPVRERDWVVVGASSKQMLDLGYRQVGKDFPVFLHPASHDEYALARTERKSGPGHTGFVVHAGETVTLEEDLRRRDLTINAIAKAADGRLIDPWGGRRDIEARTLRHVSDAFVEDPLRVFRVARLAAQLGDFTVAPETQALMRSMCAAGDLRELAAERVFRELELALGSEAPALFFTTLDTCGGLDTWFPELRGEVARLADLFGGLEEALDRFGALGKRLAAPVSLCERLKAPGDYTRLITDVAAHRVVIANWRTEDATVVYAALRDCGAVRQPDWFARVARVVDVDVGALMTALERVRSDEFRRKGFEGKALGAALDAARVEAIVSARS